MDHISGDVFYFDVSYREIGVPYGVLLRVLWTEGGKPS